MFAFELSIGPVDLAFTDRIGGVSAVPFDELNLAVGSADPAVPDNIARVRQTFGPNDSWVHLRQVHGNAVYVADGSPTEELPAADGTVSTHRALTLSVRAADCVPVLFADPEAGVIGAAHAGRAGLVAGVALETVTAMRGLGAEHIQAWIGPYVCGDCYEVPAAMQGEIARTLPSAVSTTRWGTPALNLGAGIRSQLEGKGVAVHDVSRCTLESPDLYSYRRDGADSGRHVGIIRLSR